MTASDSDSRETKVSDHPSVEEIAAYLSGKMPNEAVVALESHLSNCRGCRNEVTSARKLIRERVSGARFWVLPAAAAAVLLIALAVKPGDRLVTERASNARGEGRETITVISPGAETNLFPLRFVWRSAGSEVLYALSLSDFSGNSVWETQTMDTSIVLPQTVTLSPGTVYLWYVDASTANGMTATSGVHSFRAQR